MRILKSGFFLLLLIFIGGAVVYSAIRNDVQLKLNERITASLELNRQAAELLEKGELEEARELLLKSLSLNRLNAETYAYMAFVNLKLENHQEAYEYFISTLNMEATSVEIIKNLAEILIRSGQYQEAEKYIKYGLEDFPDDQRLLFMLGKVAFLKGDYGGSADFLSMVLEKNPDFDEAYKYLGLSYYFSGKELRAEEYYTEYLTRRGLLEEGEEKDLEQLHQMVVEAGVGHDG